MMIPILKFTIHSILRYSNGSAKGGNSSQPLVQWSEVPGHTGLLYCMTQTSNNPVVLMIQPDAILVQEIKVVPAKAKVCYLNFLNKGFSSIFTKKKILLFDLVDKKPFRKGNQH